MPYPPGMLESILGSIGEGVAVADKQGRLLVFNKAARRFFDPHLMQRRPADWPRTFGLFLPDEKTPFPTKELPLLRAIRGEKIDGLELFVRNPRVPKGVWISLSARPLRDARGRLIGGVTVFRDITEFKKAEREIVEISGREQRRIGQDLHDGLCQILLAAQFISKVLKDKLHARKIDEAQECLKEIRDHLRNSLAQADVIARGLYPVELDTRGLTAALQELARNMTRMYHVDCRFICLQSVKIVNIETSHLYRIAQEAVFNAIKGGKARRIEIRLEKKLQNIRLSVTDNGIGMPRAPKRRGMGLVLMKYRARMINAQLHISKRTSGGTRVVCLFSGKP